ncbi:hypothetical protein ACQ86N_28980 [Puia sp. P3]|uniref:hypothetical protein n=1 Tax=Puia sp. P3 TaxID=3423952 RepID=UPI003D66EAAD
MAKSKSPVRLTPQILHDLKRNGYQYVLIKGYTPDRRSDYIQLTNFTLVPVRQLPEGPGEKEIYAPIDSEIIEEWANSSDPALTAWIDHSPTKS